jgi:putative DNA-invertase from lambdoid prophage Rac
MAHSYDQEPVFKRSTPQLRHSRRAASPLLIAIFGWVAEQERARLSERTKAGMDRARRSGAHIGRPSARVDVERAVVMRRDGTSLPEIAARLNVSLATLKRVLGRLKRGASASPT